MNKVSKLTGYSFQTPIIRLSLTKASTIIPVSKQNHIISGVKSLLFIENVPASLLRKAPDDRSRANNSVTGARPMGAEDATTRPRVRLYALVGHTLASHTWRYF